METVVNHDKLHFCVQKTEWDCCDSTQTDRMHVCSEGAHPNMCPRAKAGGVHEGSKVGPCDLLNGMLLQGCLLQGSVLLLQLHAHICMLLPRHHQLPAQRCLSLHSRALVEFVGGSFARGRGGGGKACEGGSACGGLPGPDKRWQVLLHAAVYSVQPGRPVPVDMQCRSYGAQCTQQQTMAQCMTVICKRVVLL